MLTIEKKMGREAWLEGYRDSTKKVYEIGFDIFIEFMNKTENGEWNDKRLLEEREEDVKSRSFVFEEKVIEFYEWLKKYDSNFSDNTRKAYLLSIRSFFAYHRLDLRFTQQQKNKITRKPEPKRRYYDYNLSDIKKMLSVSKPKERYILAVGKELGLRSVDFISLKQGMFIAHLNEEVPIPLGEVYTQKEGVNAKPFLGYDGKEAVKQWLTVLKSRGEYDPNKPMLQIDRKELSAIMKRLTKRANINIGNQKIRFHQLRVFLITRLSKVLEENRWKQIVGKSVAESSYVKPFELKEDYAKVLPLITANTSASLPQKEELEKVYKRIMDLEKDNIRLQDLVKGLLKEQEDLKDRTRKILDFLAEGYERKEKEIEKLKAKEA